MVKGCCVHGCTANSSSNPDRTFCVIPKESTRRERWLRAINRAHVNTDGSVDTNKMWSPASDHAYVCSAHFITGKKVNDPCHPDFVPSIFPQNENSTSKSTGKLDRYSRAIKRFNTEPASESRPARKSRRCLQPVEDQTTNHSNLDIPPINRTEPQITNVHEDLASMSDSVRVPDSDCVSDEPLVSDFVTPKSKKDNLPVEMLYDEINNLRRERDEALERIASLEKLLSMTQLTSDSVEGNDTACQMMTGITWVVFLQIFTFLNTFLKPAGSSKIPLREQLFLTLLKLRHNLTFEFLAHVKDVPKSTMIDCFWKWVDFLIRWADRETIFKIVPSVFKKKFPRLTSIIDCFEIFIESPKNLLARAQCYSNYKRHTTVKCFISCNPLSI